MARTLIINADDLGYDPAVTRGILEAMRQGVVTSATLMVNTPYAEEAARAAKGLALGLHFNLARGRPAWRRFPRAHLQDGTFVEANAAALPVEVVARELFAQIDRFIDLTGEEPTHVDVHKHLHVHPNVLGGIAVAAKERALPVRSISPAMRERLRTFVPTNDHFIGDAGAEAYWTLERLRAHLAQLEDGVTELMCHPGYAPAEVKSGYAAQREVELATFTDPRARAYLERSGVRLADFRVLRD